MSALDLFLWVGLPYVALAVFVLGHVWRYRYDKFGWTTRSSQLYENRLLRLALLDARSPYAGAVVAVCATLPPLAGTDREAVARLAAEGPPGEEVGLEPFAPPSYMPDTGARR